MVLFPCPKFSALTSTGTLGVGMKLYTYAAGSVTPLATYTDADGGTENANPVVLDARGEAGVWFDGTKLYKLVLKTAADATVWTVDDVGSLTDAAVITYIEGGSDAISQTVSYKLRTYLNAMDFMTQAQRDDIEAGTGLVDVSVNLAEAWGRAGARKKDLKMPGGVYSIGNDTYGYDVTIFGLLYAGTALPYPDETPQVIFGEGMRQTRIKNNSATAAARLIRFSTPYSGLADLMLDQNSKTGDALSFYAHNSFLERVLILNAGSYALLIDGATLTTINNLKTVNCAGGVELARTTTTVEVTLQDVITEIVSLAGLRTGNASFGCSGLRVNGFYIEPVDAAGNITKFVHVEKAIQAHITNLNMEASGAKALTDTGYIGIVDSQGVTIDGVRFQHSGTASKRLFELTGGVSYGVHLNDLNLTSTKTGMTCVDIGNASLNVNVTKVTTNLTSVADGVNNSAQSGLLSVKNWVDRGAAATHHVNATDLSLENIQGAVQVTEQAGISRVNCRAAITGTGADAGFISPPETQTMATSAACTRQGRTLFDTTAGAIAATLADGLSIGDTKDLLMAVDGGTDVTLTVATHRTSNPEVFTFQDAGDHLTLRWNGTTWVTIENNGVTT